MQRYSDNTVSCHFRASHKCVDNAQERLSCRMKGIHAWSQGMHLSSWNTHTIHSDLQKMQSVCA